MSNVTSVFPASFPAKTKLDAAAASSLPSGTGTNGFASILGKHAEALLSGVSNSASGAAGRAGAGEDSEALVVQNWFARLGVSNQMRSQGKGTLAIRSVAPESASTGATEPQSVDDYLKYLKGKYGNVSVASIGKDSASLEKAGKSMRAGDIIIAPNILQEMAQSPEKAAKIESQIDHIFTIITPQCQASCAAQGLDFQTVGVIVHEDGSITHICGCADSPERVAEVNAINKEENEKKAARRQELFEYGLEAADKRRREAAEDFVKESMKAGGGPSAQSAVAEVHVLS